MQPSRNPPNTTGTNSPLELLLTSDPLSPANTCTLPAINPHAMVVRHSRHDREVMYIRD